MGLVRRCFAVLVSSLLLLLLLGDALQLLQRGSALPIPVRRPPKSKDTKVPAHLAGAGPYRPASSGGHYSQYDQYGHDQYGYGYGHGYGHRPYGYGYYDNRPKPEPAYPAPAQTAAAPVQLSQSLSFPVDACTANLPGVMSGAQSGEFPLTSTVVAWFHFTCKAPAPVPDPYPYPHKYYYDGGYYKGYNGHHNSYYGEDDYKPSRRHHGYDSYEEGYEEEEQYNNPRHHSQHHGHRHHKHPHHNETWYYRAETAAVDTAEEADAAAEAEAQEEDGESYNDSRRRLLQGGGTVDVNAGECYLSGITDAGIQFNETAASLVYHATVTLVCKLNSAAQQCSPQFGIVTATGTGSSTDTAAFTANGRARVEYSSSNDASGKLQVALDITKLAFPMPVNALYNGLASSTASGQKGAALPLFRFNTGIVKTLTLSCTSNTPNTSTGKPEGSTLEQASAQQGQGGDGSGNFDVDFTI